MLAVDVGGTFTDVVAVEDGRIKVAKVPTDPRRTDQSVLEGARTIGAAGKSVFNHASTVGLNAVITRRLPKIAFLTTIGHRDILDMGRTWRPLEALTDPNWRRPFGDARAPLVPRYLRRGIRERILADGSVLIPLDEQQAREELEVLRKCDVRGVAICLINAYVNPEHEEKLRELVRDVLGNVPCSISSEVSPLAKEYARSSTTVIDVFMKIIYETYTDELIAGLRELDFRGSVNFADCAAMLMESEFAMSQPFRLVFSGPAAGTVACAHFGQLIGERNLFCCDVGGTSSDISLVTNGEPFVETTFELEHDLLINALSNEVSSLGAGGGSIISITEAGEVAVGPESAGAVPGPACYGRGGQQPTMTDACVLMGIIDPDKFLGGSMQLDSELATAAFDRLDTHLDLDQRVSYAYNMGLNNIAEGLVDIAVKHGIDPRDYTLLAYGAAGPMLLPAVLDLVHARRVIVPPHPGLFSALGLLSSDLVYSLSRSSYVVLDPSAAEQIDRVYKAMEDDLLTKVPANREDVVVKRTFDGRLLGQTWETPFIEVPDGDLDGESITTMVESFHKVYEERYGNRFALPVQGVTYRVQVILPIDKVSYPALEKREGAPLEPVRTVSLRYLGDGEMEAAEYERASLSWGDEIAGPAIIREDLSTTHVGARQRATIGRYGEVVIERNETGKDED
jgi:N-methylhydantoinase A